MIVFKLYSIPPQQQYSIPYVYYEDILCKEKTGDRKIEGCKVAC